MRIESTQQSQAAGVTGAIQQAAKATGTSFQYLLATAKVESNLNPDAAAKTSSAGGLFQFIEQTWFGTIKEAGPSLGYGRYANAITRTDSGRYVVNNPEAKAEILKLRQDPTANAMMAGVLTRSNAAVLSQKLGRQPTDGELYIAHFLGAKGAATLIGQSERQPGVTAASVFPNAARANRSIFFDKEGRPRNVADVSATLSNRFQVALAKQPAPVALAQAAPASVPAERSAAVAPIAAATTTATRAVVATNPLAIPQAGAIPPSVAGRLAAITPAPSSRGAVTAPYMQAQPVQTTDDLTPITSTANARVTRAYEVLSPNMVRSLTAPVSTTSTTSVPAVQPVSVAPEIAPAPARSRVSFDGEQVYSNPYRVAERREPVAPVVTDLWAQASANAARARAITGNTASAEIRKPPVQRMASVAPASMPAQTAEAVQPQNVAAATPAPASAEPLGLFQDIKPNVRALFTGG